jgi:hypothetical protein
MLSLAMMEKVSPTAAAAAALAGKLFACPFRRPSPRYQLINERRSFSPPMTDPRAIRSKAEASHRLAELAKTPRAKELFKQLAEDYENRARAQAEEAGEVAPSIVPPTPSEPAEPLAPLAESEQWLANLAAVRAES